MKIACLILSSVCLLNSLQADEQPVMTDHLIEYSLQDHKYAIVIVENGLSEEEAKKLALQRAADLAKEKGFQHYKIDSEGEVKVALTSKEFPSESSMPRNIYYELIQSDNFGRQPIEPGEDANVTVYPGYRLIISLY
jgi:hypothetical protein